MTSQLKVMEKVMEVMEFEELKRSTNPSQAQYSTLHPLFSRATPHVTTPLVQRKFYVTTVFTLEKCFVVPCFICSYSRTFVSA